MEISYTGYQTQKITDIVVNEGRSTNVDIAIEVGSGNLIDFDFCCGGCTIPLIRHDENTNKFKITSEQIRNLPTRNINKILTITPGLSLTQ